MSIDTRVAARPDGDVPDTSDDADPPGRLRPVLWRLHFISGFLVAPVAIWLAVTGTLYAWNPQIESVLFGDRQEVTGRGELAPLSDQVDAALAANPGHRVLSVAPAGEAGDATEVALAPEDAQGAPFTPPPGALTAYVDPVTTDVVGRLDDTSRPDEWLRNMHSNFKLGPTVGTLTELAASWVVVSLATGLYLWWPKSRRALRRAFVPRLQGLRRGGRRPWRDLHSVIGVAVLVPLVAIVATGLTWTEYAGRWVDVAKDATAAESPSLDPSLPGSGPAAGAHDGGTNAEHAGHVLDSASPATFDDIDKVLEGAKTAGLHHPFTITAPAEMGLAWTAAEVDDRWPVETTSVSVDAATGKVTDRLEFGDGAALDQATSLGIYFHQGTLFGLFNQLLLTVLAGALIALLVTGYVAWWRRRPARALAVPPRYEKLFRNVPVPLVLGFAATMVLLPTLGVTFVVYLVVERLYRAVRPGPTPALAP
jgi:uncharacterized iron-regulated membrane protein